MRHRDDEPGARVAMDVLLHSLPSSARAAAEREVRKALREIHGAHQIPVPDWLQTDGDEEVSGGG